MPLQAQPPCINKIGEKSNKMQKLSTLSNDCHTMAEYKYYTIVKDLYIHFCRNGTQLSRYIY